MGSLLYVLAVILVISWAVGYLGYHAGGAVHLLLVLAAIILIVRIFQARKIV